MFSAPHAVQDPHYKIWIPKRCEAQGCNKRADLKKCVVCGCVMYCSKACQRADWPRHKQECSHLKELKVWPQVYRVPADDIRCRASAIDACQPAKAAPRTDACNLCGGTENLETMECCGVVLCNNEHNYQLMSYSRDFCARSHRRYSKCGQHFTEKEKHAQCQCCPHHAGKLEHDWRECHPCLNEMQSDEWHLWVAAGPYNTKPPRPPLKGTMWTTQCDGCGRRNMTGLEGCAIYNAGDGPRPGGIKLHCNTCCPQVKSL